MTRSFIAHGVAIAPSIVLAALIGSAALAAEPVARVSEGRRDGNGVIVHAVESEFQRGATEIRVLLPDEYDASKRYRVAYVLPPMEQGVDRHGDGLAEIRSHDLHNRHQLICVTPTYTLRPWYADHPTDDAIRHESFFTRVVVPFVDRTYATRADSAGRLLLGFSKSGYGAFSMLLRRPESFGRAAAFDSSFLHVEPTEPSLETYGTSENYARYRVPALVVERRDALRAAPRLCLVGFGNAREHHEGLHRQLVELDIPHGYLNQDGRAHRWDSGWLPEAVNWLAAENPPH